jgi:hypothetical protein
VDLDPLEQKTTIQIRSTLWRGDQRVAQEEYIMVSMRYFRNEVLLMLEQAGFQGGYTDAVATAEDTLLVVVAHKSDS